MSCSLFDRYITSKVQPTDTREVQLIALTSLYIVVKINEQRNFYILKTFVKLGQGTFCERDIEKMERNMLDTLQWLVNPPSPHVFVNSFLNMAPSSISTLQKDVLIEKATYITELMLLKGEFIHEKYSRMAMASISLAISDIDERRFSIQDQKEFFVAIEELTGISLGNVKLLSRKFEVALEIDGVNLHRLSVELDPDNTLFKGLVTSKEGRHSPKSVLRHAMITP